MKDFLKNVYEYDLYPPIIQYFEDQNYSIELEIPIHRNRIDLIAFNNDHLIAVELKLKNWQRALRQATAFRSGMGESSPGDRGRGLPLGRGVRCSQAQLGLSRRRHDACRQLSRWGQPLRCPRYGRERLGVGC